MRTKNLAKMLMLAAVLATTGIACEREEGPAEEFGEDIDETSENMKDGFEDLGDEMKGEG